MRTDRSGLIEADFRPKAKASNFDRIFRGISHEIAKDSGWRFSKRWGG